ncbi:MAG: hypothetical protein FWD56_07065, partial [Bacteroidales bacterium]|nr:hypothetical protein [Bacteroidales bacterium]
MKHFVFGSIVLLFLFLGSCGQQQGDPYPNATLLYAPEYARGFFIKREDNKRILYVKKSWLDDDQSSFTYVLYPRSDSLLYQQKAGYIPYPVQKAVCLSTTHIAYLETITQSDVIKGISGAQYLSNQHIRQEVSLGKVKDVGYESALNYEALLSLH